MRKIFTTLLAVCAFYGYSQAQTQAGQTEFGVTAGVGSSYVTAGTNQNSSSLVVFNAGVSADYYFSDRWSLKVKALYDQKGWSDGYINISTSSTQASYGGIDYKLAYVTIPVMANWHFGSSRNWYLNFGPYVGILMSAKASGQYSGDVKSVFNTTDAGLALGLGYKFPLSENSKFFVELDGQGGATNVAKGNGSTLQNARSGLNIGINF